jgi:hypothetical protein
MIWEICDCQGQSKTPVEIDSYAVFSCGKSTTVSNLMRLTVAVHGSLNLIGLIRWVFPDNSAIGLVGVFNHDDTVI